MKLTLEHESGVKKDVKLGFSWTTFFFGLFVPLIRGDLKWAGILLLLDLLVGSFTMGIGAWVVNLIFAFVYNRLYVRDLVEKGYKPQRKEEEKYVYEYIKA